MLASTEKETMSTSFSIQSSDPALLEKATRVAHTFVQPYRVEEMVGIVFLGSIARGYYDSSADIDIALFKRQGSGISFPAQFLHVEDLEVHIHLADYESECSTEWDMSKRWTFSQGQIHYDPQGKVAQLLADKVPLKPEEKRWLLMSGCTLSEWYVNRLTHLWVERGSMISAQHMFFQGLNYFFDMLFALNDELVADMKWRYFCVEKLPRLPAHFQEHIQETMLQRAFSMEELERRRNAFMEMWREMLPVIEQEVHLSYDEILMLT
jgi:hypothetical protein